MIARTTSSPIADQSQTSHATNSEPTQVALVSLDGTPGDAFQLLGVINPEGTVLASVDRRRLPVEDAVTMLHEVYGTDTEIVIGVMPERAGAL